MTEPDPDNSYQSPTANRENVSTGNPLLIPGMILLVLATATLGIILFSLAGQYMSPRGIDTTTHQGQGQLIGNITWIAMNAAIIWGSIAMLRLDSYRNAWIAAVLAVIPVCSPCLVLGIPFGIWAIVVLLRTDVRESFYG